MNTPQLQLDYPVWRLSFSAYAEANGLDIGGNFTSDRVQANEDEWKRNVEYQPAPDELKDFYYGDRDE